MGATTRSSNTQSRATTSSRRRASDSAWILGLNPTSAESNPLPPNRPVQLENGALWRHTSAPVGAWRSLVARFVRDEEVAGSNPVAPTISTPPPALPESSITIRTLSRLAIVRTGTLVAVLVLLAYGPVLDAGPADLIVIFDDEDVVWQCRPALDCPDFRIID